MNNILGPLERMSILGIGYNKGIDGFTHVPSRHSIEPTQSLAPEYAKPAFHLVEPGSMRRSVMEVDVGISRKPAIVLGLVGVKVIQDDMEFLLRIMRHNLIPEVEKLPATPARVVGPPVPVQWLFPAPRTAW